VVVVAVQYTAPPSSSDALG